MRPETCAECGRPALLQSHPFLEIGTGKPATFAPLMVCRECFPARRSTREQMSLFATAGFAVTPVASAVHP